jgi:hypothetical protein
MNTNRGVALIVSLVCLGVTAAVIVNTEPFVRLIPADVLRGQFHNFIAQIHIFAVLKHIALLYT